VLAQGRPAALSALTVLGAALVPKCPLCLAAYLTSFGVSGTVAAWAAPWLRPAAALLSLGSLVLLALGLLQSVRRKARSRPSSHASCGGCRAQAGSTKIVV